jgi:hypothetical protein
MTTPIATDSMHRSPLRRSLLFIPLALACFALGSLAQAQLSPPPDDGYPNGNTAEGDSTMVAGPPVSTIVLLVLLRSTITKAPTTQASGLERSS